MAIAGGSMIREVGGRIVDVGSRSAHIAGLNYACFQQPDIFVGAKLVHLRPTEKDTDDYTAIETTNGQRFSLTPTCAANLLGVIPNTAFAKGNAEAAWVAFKPLADKIGKSVEDTARDVLEISCRKVAKQIEALITEYHLDRNMVELIGGGGGAASLVLFTGQLMGLPARLAKRAEVISTIGVALAMVRDTIERNIVNPSPDDILTVRREAAEAVMKIGAVSESIEVQVEVDTRRNLVRATAFGTTELKKDENTVKSATFSDCLAAAARSLQVESINVKLLGQTSTLYVFAHMQISTSFFGLLTKKQNRIRITDKTGVIRLQRSHAEVVATDIAEVLKDLEEVINNLTDFGDAGRSLPDIHLLVGSRIINLSGLADLGQALALAKTELEHFAPDETVLIVATKK